jgi:2-polyprenyl-3-methyl-5-hydroxy-6-metoxy-1,4-benzoquinol methylase
MNKNIKCRVCGSDYYDRNLLSYNNMPASAQGFLKYEELESDTGSTLNVVQCSSCGLIQLDNPPVSYYKEVIRASAFSKEMREFRLEQFRLWVDKYKLENKKILEVGCGKGEYLEILTKSRVNASGLEYSKKSVSYCKEKSLSVTQGFLGDENLELPNKPYDGFVCLSFMEHWPNPNKTLQSLRQDLLDGAIGIIEVPNFDMILNNGLYSEFISDHLMYFTKETLSFILQFNGFEVFECESIWHDYILSAVVRKKARTNLDFFEGFRDKVKKDLNKFINQFPNKKVAVWGAGHQALAVISLSEIGNKIKYIVDSATFKQGKYTPASHIKIVSEGELINSPVDAVIIMAGSYSDEILRVMKNQYSKTKVAVLREYGLELI